MLVFQYAHWVMVIGSWKGDKNCTSEGDGGKERKGTSYVLGSQ